MSDIATCANALVAGMGLQRYAIIEMRRGVVTRLLQNAPAELLDEAAAVAAIDPLITRARTSPRPFIWQAGAGGTWRDLNGDAGYRSGVAGSSQDAERSGCIALLSCADDCIAPETATMLMTYALTAAVSLAGALERLAPEVCPFSRRELDCLLHTLAGHSSRETAHALGIGARTVEQYLARARARLQTTSSYAAATTALRRGWLDLQQALDLAALDASTGEVGVGGIDDAEQREDELKHSGLS